MEELRSTEILDKEIENDARKKAAKIISSAQEEAKKILEDVDSRVEAAQKERTEFYQEKISRYEKNAEASVPLEKERFLVSFYSGEVAKAFNEYLKSLGAEKRLALLEEKIPAFKDALGSKKVSAVVYGLELGAAKKMLEKSLGKNLAEVSEVLFEKSGESPEALNEIHEGIILESEDKSVRCRLTTDQTVREIKDKYSFELASSLFGGRLPE